MMIPTSGDKIRPFLPLALAVGALSCSDSPEAGERPDTAGTTTTGSDTTGSVTDSGESAGGTSSDTGDVPPGEPPDQPNIILLLADDLGYDDLGFREGQQHLETPNLDQLAARSVRFTQFYTEPVCATTRAALLTGRNALSTGVWGVHGGRDFLPIGETLVSEVLQDAGYRTAMMGKWHNGRSGGYQPWERGFEEAYTAHLYAYQNNQMLHNGIRETRPGWVTPHLVDLAIDFIDADDSRPFFIYLPFLTPHEPWEAPPEYLSKYRERGLSQGLSAVYGMIDHLDRNIGRLLDHVDARGLRDDTVVVFMSDNGPWNTSSNGLSLSQSDWQLRNPSDLRANKGEVFENGVRVPLLVSFGTWFEQRDADGLTDVTDLFPTLLELAGATLPDGALPLHGRSIGPMLRGEPPATSRVVFHAKNSVRVDNQQLEYGHFPDKAVLAWDEQIISARDEDHKLVVNYGGGRLLFDVRNDPTESVNLYADRPDIAGPLEAELERWYGDVVASPVTFSPAVERIGHGGAAESIVHAMTASSHGGSLWIASWAARDWNEVDDFIQNNVEVVTPGTYTVSVEYTTQNLSGSVVRLTVGATSFERAVDTENAESWGGGKYLASFGTFDLEPGPTQVELRVIAEGSDTETSVFENVERYHFVAETGG